jgi:hypothetical protein
MRGHPQSTRKYHELESAFYSGVGEEDEKATVTTRQLRKWFDQYNELYFDGKLRRPAITIKELDGHTLGLCDLKEKRISISSRILKRPELARRVLVHEMIHLVSAGHRGTYLTVLEKLNNLGEEWAGKEASLYRGDWIKEEEFDGPGQDFRDYVRDMLENIALDFARKNIKPDLRKVKRMIAGQMDIDPKEVDSFVPWLREEWRRIKWLCLD